MNKVLLKAVNNAITRNPFENQNDNILTGVITYRFIMGLMARDPSVQSSLNSISAKYVESFKNVVSDMKNKYVSYMVIMSKLNIYGIKSFLNISDDIINEIYRLYLDKTKLVPFSVTSYAPEMYSISEITWEQNERLRKIHYSVMVPIMKQYIGNNNLHDSALKIYSALVYSDTPGKGIIFYIDGISPNRILTDIRKPSIGISDYIYKAQTYDNMVLLIIR